MAWTVDYSPAAQGQLNRLGPQMARRIDAFMNERVAPADNPRHIGHPLHGSFGGQWSYRVGDYRVICEIQDDRLVVLVVRVGHRSRVYR